MKITESDLHKIVQQVINEIGYRGATSAVGANMNANKELANGRIQNKTNKHEEIR